MNNFNILSRTKSSPFMVGEDVQTALDVLGSPDSTGDSEEDIDKSQWLTWNDFDMRLLIANSKIIGVEFYNKPEVDFKLSICGEVYSHDMASLKRLQAKGVQIYKGHDGYRVPDLNLALDIVRFEDQTVSLIYSDDDYHKGYDAFEYWPVTL